MIAGSATDGDSNLVRKAHGMQFEVYGIRTEVQRGSVISFGSEDLSGMIVPPTNALMIQAAIVNYVVARVFVDTGSSINIIFKDAFN